MTAGWCWPSWRVLCYRSRCCCDVCDKMISLPLKSRQGFTLALPCRKLLQNLSLPSGSPARLTARLASVSTFEHPWPAATAGLLWDACPAESCTSAAPCSPLSTSAERGQMATVELQSTVDGIPDTESLCPHGCGDMGGISHSQLWLQHLYIQLVLSLLLLGGVGRDVDHSVNMLLLPCSCTISSFQHMLPCTTT